MIGKDTSPEVGKETQWKPGQSGNPAGKVKGTKNLRTIILELEAEDYDWNLVPLQPDGLAKAKEIGAPWRAIVKTALAKAFSGNMQAAEWLRKAGYGDKMDITTNGKDIVQPLMMPVITKREPEKEEESTDSKEGSEAEGDPIPEF